MGYFSGSNPKTNASGVLMSSVEKYQRLMAEEQERREKAALQIGVDEANLSRHNERFDQETKLLDAAVVGTLKRHFGGADGIDAAVSGRFGVQPKRLAIRLIEMLQSISEGVDDEGYALPETDPEIVAYFADVMEEELGRRTIPNSDRSNTSASLNDPEGNDQAFLSDFEFGKSPHDFDSSTRSHEAATTFAETLARLTGEAPAEREARIENEQVRQRELSSGDRAAEKEWLLDPETGLPTDSFSATFGFAKSGE